MYVVVKNKSWSIEDQRPVHFFNACCLFGVGTWNDSIIFGSIIFAASWRTLFLGVCAKRCRGSWFIHSCLPFCVWRWSIC